MRRILFGGLCHLRRLRPVPIPIQGFHASFPCLDGPSSPDLDFLEDEDRLSEDLEIIVGEPEIHEYQAETRRLLDIVANSLYKNKEIFVRELISNSCDALERRRQESLFEGFESSVSSEPRIEIFVDERNGTFTITDSGCGMTRQELEENIGTICYSGSDAFRQSLAGSSSSTDDVQNLIGQFGVGFYSVFMVADEVQIFTRSHLSSDEEGIGWSFQAFSDDPTHYRLSEASGVPQGTKIILKMSENAKDYCVKELVDSIIRTYSNFIACDIFLNGSKVETLDAIWLKPKNAVSPEEHRVFYEYLTHTTNIDPLHAVHIQTDIPVSIRSVLYIPPKSGEQFGMLNPAQAPGVNLYSNKVLIAARHGEVLPPWLRFVCGAVDSEDLPLNISRESVQDDDFAMVNLTRIRSILVRKVLQSLERLMKDDFQKYLVFYEEYEKFLKEGITSDLMNAENIAKLLVFETSRTAPGVKKSLQQVVEDMPSSVSEIYFLVSTSREVAESSPYFDAFRGRDDIEVIFTYNPVLDDFVFASIGQVEGRPLVSIENSAGPAGEPTTAQSDRSSSSSVAELDESDVSQLSVWIREALGAKVASVQTTDRLGEGTPAIVLNPENPTARLMRRMQNPNVVEVLPPQHVAINPKSSIIVGLHRLVDVGDHGKAKFVAEQIVDNALLSAQLLDDPRLIVGRLNALLEMVLAGSESDLFYDLDDFEDFVDMEEEV